MDGMRFGLRRDLHRDESVRRRLPFGCYRRDRQQLTLADRSREDVATGQRTLGTDVRAVLAVEVDAPAGEVVRRELRAGSEIVRGNPDLLGRIRRRDNVRADGYRDQHKQHTGQQTSVEPSRPADPTGRW